MQTLADADPITAVQHVLVFLDAPPEQARGPAADERDRVFSAGVLLFERLTGRHPFGAEGNPRRMARIRKGELGSGVNFFPAVPSGLRSILLRAMGPFPEERWSSMSDLRQALEEWLSEATGENRMESEPTRIIPLPRSSTTHRAVPPPPPEPSLRAAPPADDLFLVDPPMLRRRSPVLAPLLWLSLGAALASLAFTLSRSTPAPTPVPAPVPTPAMPEAISPSTTTPTPVVTGAAPAVVTDPPAIFDAQLGGERALTAAQTCFGPARLTTGVVIDLGLLYSADGAVKKIYFPIGELAPAERACLSRSILGLSAGAGTGQTEEVEYRFHLRTAQSAVHIRTPRP